MSDRSVSEAPRSTSPADPRAARPAATARRVVAWRPDAVVLAVLAVVALALALRLYDLGTRAVHHDESLHGAFAWYFAEGRGYRHDPLMHGPLQFHLIAALFKLFGSSESVMRLPAALAGSALVAAPLLLRRWLGGTGVVVAALLIALSPTLLYYSRFARNDLLIALWTLGLVAAIWRYREQGGPSRGGRWLALLAGALALAFATKETAYLTLAVLLLYFDGALALEIATGRGARGPARWLFALGLLPVAWLAAAGWRWLRLPLRLGERPRSADLLVVIGTLTLPLLAAAVQLPVLAAGGTLSAADERALGLASAALLLLAGAAVGLAWDWRCWLLTAGIFYAITLPLYASLGTNVEGVAGLFWTSLDYWLDQHAVERGSQPWFYYLMLLPLYEFLTLLPALAGGLWLLRRGDRFASLLLWWAAGTLVALSFAGEKMPWLTVHVALPLALLAAYALGAALPALARRARAGPRPLAAGLVLAVVAAAALLLAVFSLRTAAAVSYLHPDTPVEPLIYTQTSPDVPALARQVEAFAAAGPGREDLVVVVDTTASFTWPWAWYLRHFPQVRYEEPADLLGRTPEGAVLIAAQSTLAAHPSLRERLPVERPYRHRWWFPEERYREITFTALLGGIGDGTLPADWMRFYASGVDPGQIASIDGAVLFPAGAEATLAEATPR